jgi:hypothetical protein
MPICSQEVPTLSPAEDGRLVSCHLYPDDIKKIDKHAPVAVPASTAASTT